MEIKIKSNGVWYHGSNVIFSQLRKGSTVTQWKELAEAFSHRPTYLCYDDQGRIKHNGMKTGYLFVIDEPIQIGIDVCPVPKTTMDKNAEFLTLRP